MVGKDTGKDTQMSVFSEVEARCLQTLLHPATPLLTRKVTGTLSMPVSSFCQKRVNGSAEWPEQLINMQRISL